jgi:hypothetical protein
MAEDVGPLSGVLPTLGEVPLSIPSGSISAARPRATNARDAPEAVSRAPIAEALVTGLPSAVLIR